VRFARYFAMLACVHGTVCTRRDVRRAAAATPTARGDPLSLRFYSEGVPHQFVSIDGLIT
jgi:hypothetical protein